MTATPAAAHGSRVNDLGLLKLLSPYLRRPVARSLLLGSTYAAAGVAEAVALILIVRAAVGIVNSEDSLQLGVGPWLSVELDLAVVLALALLATLLSVLVRVPGYRLAASMYAEGISSARIQAFESYIHSAWDARTKEDLGGLQYLISSHADRVGTVISLLTATLSSLFTLAAYVLGALVVSPVFAAIATFVFAVSFLLLQPVRRVVGRRSASMASSNREVNRLVAEASAVAKETYVLGAATEQLARLRRAQESYAEDVRRTGFVRGLIPDVYRASFFAVLLAGLALSRSIAHVDLAAAGGAILLLLRSITYVKSLQTVSLSLTEYEPYLVELAREVSRYRCALPSGKTVPLGFETLQATDVYYSYDGARTWAVRGLNLVVSKGESVAVVGPSGSGKSTLVDLLLGLRSPTAGRLTINDVDFSDISRSWWHTNAALVDQEARLIAGRIDENIRFFRSEISSEAIYQAAHHAYIIEVVEGLPAGYATVLGSGGIGLSGGQKQRLAIARALAGSPSIVVLDEPTSALDMSSEFEVVEALQSLRGETTVVVVSHRPSILRLCDRVVVLIDGSVAADGKPDEVLESNAFFRSMMADGDTLR